MGGKPAIQFVPLFRGELNRALIGNDALPDLFYQQDSLCDAHGPVIRRVGWLRHGSLDLCANAEKDVGKALS